MAETPESFRAPFVQTSWPLVMAAQQDRAAQGQLIERYWRPVYAFLRRRGLAREEAEDCTQAFFVNAIERELFGRADPEKGRFRTFLLCLVQRFVRDEHERAQRRFERGVVAWDQLRSSSSAPFEPRDDHTPENAFECEWACAVRDRAWEGFRRECQTRQERQRWFEAVRVRNEAEANESREELARRLDLTPGQYKNALEQGSALFRSSFQNEVRLELGLAEGEDESLVEEELRWTIELLRSPGCRGGSGDEAGPAD